MHIYLAGIGGVGLGPLAEIARGAGYDVSGSDKENTLVVQELTGQDMTVFVYPQDGSKMRDLHAQKPIDWFVYTSALPDDHAELVLARELGIRTSKRDELLSHIITERELKLIAVAGTHGKTTTTGMLVWTMQALGIPVSYSVGTTLSFGPAGLFDLASQYFIYECDEYDRNFLAFNPYVALITTIDHDHFDTFPDKTDYHDAFRQFADQSSSVITWQALQPVFAGDSHVLYVSEPDSRLTLPGELSRQNATLVVQALERLLPVGSEAIISAINDFPGTDRRFERLADNLYSDYGHHPVEIAATLQMASEYGKRVVLVYQPHQNARQHEIIDDYTATVFSKADHVYWLPTYLTREVAGQPTLSPRDLSRQLPINQVTSAELDEDLWQAIERERTSGALVLCMGAGSIDEWLRRHVRQQ